MKTTNYVSDENIQSCKNKNLQNYMNSYYCYSTSTSRVWPFTFTVVLPGRTPVGLFKAELYDPSTIILTVLSLLLLSGYVCDKYIVVWRMKMTALRSSLSTVISPILYCNDFSKKNCLQAPMRK